MNCAKHTSSNDDSLLAYFVWIVGTSLNFLFLPGKLISSWSLSSTAISSFCSAVFVSSDFSFGSTGLKNDEGFFGNPVAM